MIFGLRLGMYHSQCTVEGQALNVWLNQNAKACTTM